MQQGATTLVEERAKARQPCLKCGGPKELGRGRKFCKDCQELISWETARRKANRTILKRHPCEGCGKLKGPGSARRYCDKCIEARKWNQCWRCHRFNILKPSRDHYCIECKKVAKIEKRVKDAERKRKARKDPVKLARMRKEQKESVVRMKADKQRRAIFLERRRIEYRMKVERKQGTFGKTISLQSYRNGNGRLKRTETLPLEPLMQLIKDSGRSWYEVGELTNLDEAVIRRIMTGNMPPKHINIVEQICVGLGTTLSLVYESNSDVRRVAGA